MTVDLLALVNPSVSVTVRRDGEVVLARATGTTIDGAPATSDSPMVVASVGKLLTATLLARVDEEGRVDLDAPMPWSLIGLSPHPAWTTVTPRELLNHTSGMPVVRRQWFERSGDCRSFLPTILGTPPAEHRGRWTYSNGNYCALGLLAEAVTGLPLDAAAELVLLDPAGATGVHLTTGGQRPGDVAYPLGVDRLGRLGGAGSYLVSTDDVAAVLDGVTDVDRGALVWPGVMVDQYGWGHTGSVDGATSCAWVLEGGRTVMVVTVSGTRPATGGALCDGVVPALATDLGIGAGEPERSPP
jgi:CubicO group peptidase (beta-lactamase class C family)